MPSADTAPWHSDTVRAYLEKHGIEQKLTRALNAAIHERAPDPAAHISALLAPLPPPLPPAEGRRRFFVGGNWKCKGTRQSITSLVADLNAIAPSIPKDVEAVIFPSHLHIDLLARTLHPPFRVGAQNCSDVMLGELTGSVRAEALADFGIGWVLLGHSDRRNAIGESSELIAQKAAAALAAGMSVNLTVGETKAQRDAGEHLEALSAQLAPAAALISDPASWERIVVAYEPVWAIGAGATPCTPEQAQQVHAHIRAYLGSSVGSGAAERARIVYTGSVSTANCRDFVQQPDIDGFVVGRASLHAQDFLTVCCARELA